MFTPTKYEVSKMSNGQTCIRSKRGLICTMESGAQITRDGDAKLIVERVNSHDALVSALSRAVSQLKFLQSQHADAWHEDEEREVMDAFEEGKKALLLANA